MGTDLYNSTALRLLLPTSTIISDKGVPKEAGHMQELVDKGYALNTTIIQKYGDRRVDLCLLLLIKW